MRAARSVVEFDDHVVAPRYGFASAVDYYARCSAQAVIGAIQVPALVIHSRDDTWIPAQPFLDRAWRANPRLRLALSERGGHVGFHGAGGQTPWHDTLIGQFFLSG